MTLVLVVEDNRALAENIAELFDDSGAQVEVAATASKAIAFAQSYAYDLALVDLHLPGAKDGVVLVPELRGLCRQGEIILITGHASLDTAIEAVKQGVFAYVQKPFDAGDLLALCERALAQVRLRKEREDLARDLSRSEALYRGVVDTVDALILGLDEDDRILFANHRAQQTVGVGFGALEGRLLAELAIDEDRPRLHRALEQARAGVQGERLVRLVADLEGRAVVRFSFARLSSVSGVDSGLLLAVGRDETKWLELERRTAKSEAMAAMGTLTAGLAHEVRNPLNAAKLQLELLGRSARKVADETLASRIEDRVGIVKLEIARLSQMLDEFLVIARPLAIAPEPFDLLALIEEVVRLEAPLAGRARVQIELAGYCGPVQVAGDRAKVKQVMVNLIGNAVEAMNKVSGGRVTISYRLLGDEVVSISVSDTGAGLRAEIAGQVFEPFFTTKEAGTGLGLSIVKRLVELHGGEVDLRDRQDDEAGTEAVFTLPLASRRGD